MSVTRLVARPMLAGMFVFGGLDAVRNPETKAPKAEGLAPKVAEPLGLPTDPVTLVRLNGAVQVGAGLLLAFGKCPRLAALALVGSLVPTTYAGHRFWEETDDTTRAQQQIQFFKNMGLMGGLLLAAADTGGRPSVTWTARRTAKAASKAAGSATQGATAAVKRVAKKAS